MPILPNALAKITRASDNDNAVLSLPLSKAAFSFDSFGVAGFFGGDSSVAAMATANLIPARRWVGWYNNPGSYEMPSVMNAAAVPRRMAGPGGASWDDGMNMGISGMGMGMMKSGAISVGGGGNGHGYASMML